MQRLLAGDIGGTKTILRLVQVAPPSSKPQEPATTLYEATYNSAHYADLVPLVRQFFQEAGQFLNPWLGVVAACFGIAGPVVNQRSELTNLRWVLEADRLQQELAIPLVRLINDFVAVGYGTLALQPQDLCTLQQGQQDDQAPIAVLGAGTGLGEGFLIPGPYGYQPYACEGGHVDFAPRTLQESQLLHYVMTQEGLSRVSIERILSGQGIVRIYDFLKSQQGEATIGDNLEIGTAIDQAAAISAAALAKQNPLCEQTLNWFVSIYGAEAGNWALKLLPYGGLYIAGGIAPKILPLIQSGIFMTAFLAKGRMNNLLQRVPVHVVLNSQVGLIGAVVCAQRCLELA